MSTNPTAIKNIANEMRTLPTRGDSPGERYESAGRLLLAGMCVGAFSDDVSFCEMVRQRAEQTKVNGFISAWGEAVYRLRGKAPGAGLCNDAAFPADCALVADALDSEADRLARVGVADDDECQDALGKLTKAHRTAYLQRGYA